MLSPPSEQCCESEVAMLEPNKVNVHMIEALDDGAAFFDLLVPGYHSENRPCTYYNIINDNQVSRFLVNINWFLPQKILMFI